MPSSVVVVKVGGSLYDLPDLGSRLRAWLTEQCAGDDVVLVPGGGGTADVIRHFDRVHGLGEETSHWLALRALTLNAQFSRVPPSAGLCRRHDRLAARRLGKEPITDPRYPRIRPRR